MIDPDLRRRLRRLELTSRRLVDEQLAGAYRSAFKGQGMELDDVRDYVPGDPVRAIDWNVTARSGEPFVKSFREERERTLILAVDVSASGRFGSGAEGKLDVALELSALLALAATQDRDRVGLLLFSDRVEGYLPPRKGRKQVLRLLRELASCDPQGRGTELSVAVSHLEKVHRRRALVVLVSDLLGTDVEGALPRLASRHETLALLPTDPAEQAPPALGLVTLVDPETGAEALVDTSDPGTRRAFAAAWEAERGRALGVCRRAGVETLELALDRDWFEDLRRFLYQRARQRAPRRRRAS
ncbi:MAG: DUF58 domain-containing protein [Planctomycetota bacterium]